MKKLAAVILFVLALTLCGSALAENANSPINLLKLQAESLKSSRVAPAMTNFAAPSFAIECCYYGGRCICLPIPNPYCQINHYHCDAEIPAKNGIVAVELKDKL